MQASQLKPASQLAQRYGAKCVAYGPPGAGKTPLMKTAPRPVLCVTEPGMLSMRDAHDIPAWEAYTPAAIAEFFKWAKESNEARNFDTICVDSASQMAEIILKEELLRNKDGRKAYGEMARKVMDYLNDLYYMPQKHVYLIAKQGNFDEGGVQVTKPYFPGQDLNVRVPHMFDEILHIALVNIPAQPKPVTGIRSTPTFNIMARDRSGNLAEIEPPHLGNLFNKIMS